jgi:hypothetical protein
MPSSAWGPRTGPWPGDDALGAELSHALACGGAAGEGTLDDERRAAVERDVTSEHEPTLGYPHHHVIRGVRGPDVVQLELEVIDVDIEPVGERGEGRHEVYVPEFGRGEELLSVQPCLCRESHPPR